ncbi:MAG: alpha glucosidase [Gammaproteobacteria bacterium]|nr:alpha glucosidase [Gammaproteobacteria bacterium]
MEQLQSEWWRNGIIYQVYPRSFLDSNNDGIGDLNGITSKLPYIKSLGVDAVWLSPFFKSPMADFGYDVSDYRDVDPMFGDMKDFDRLIEEAHDNGLKVIIDQVYSHTSDQHAWFEESRQSRDNPKADWYVWVDTLPDGNPPNNWVSVFGGSSWKWDTRRKQYYLHNFLTEQPDLNVHNPEVQDQLLSDLRFWLDRGVDGFRLDAINFCCHNPSLADNPAKFDTLEGYGDKIPTNQYDYQWHVNDKTQPETERFLQRIREVLDEYPGTMAVGEIGDDNMIPTMTRYTTENRLHCAYSFELLSTDCDAPFIRRVVSDAKQLINEGWACWSIGNHDVPRVMTRWNKEDSPLALKEKRIALFWLMQFTLRGNTCIYQGEELGLDEAEIAFEDLQDPYGINLWPEFKGRDGCRTPMPWVASLPHAGFSSAKPWLPVPESHTARSVDVMEADRDSLLHRFRHLTEWKRAQPWLTLAELELTEDNPNVLTYIRTHNDDRYFVAINLSHETQTLQQRLQGEDLTPKGFAYTLHDGEVTLPAAGAMVIKIN